MNTNIEPKTLLSLPQVARLLGGSPTAVRTRLDRAGQLPDGIVQAGAFRGQMPVYDEARIDDLAAAVGRPAPVRPLFV
jgi:hypothetical protein